MRKSVLCHQISDSQSDVCVQAADVIAGSISVASQDGLDSPEGTEIMRILRTQLDRGMFVVFPRDSASSTYLIGTNERTEYNETIEKLAVNEAYGFIEHFAFSSDFAKLAQVEFARALLEHNHLEGSDGWLSTDRLRQRYTECFKGAITDQKLRGTIGALRDAGLLVASRSAGGYKLPASEADLYEFLNNYNSKLDPMVLRIRKARDIVRRATDAKLDILGKPEFRNLREAIDATPDWERNRPPLAGEPPGDLD